MTFKSDDIVGKIYEKVRNYHRLTFPELANEAGISVGYCHAILTENVQMRWIAVKYFPQLLSLEEKENHLTFYQDLKNCSADVNFTKNMTGSETWVYGYNPETKFQSFQ